ncbi:MAG: hypothetical protein LBP81_01640 [Treponema sp.]|nr:hypothetical protein [Treponema sp.]
MKFGTWSHLSLENYFDADDFTPRNSGINARSYLKFSGQALPRMQMFMEIKAFEVNDSNNLYRNSDYNADNGLTFADGSQHYLTDLFTNPFKAIDQAAKPTLDNLGITFQTSYLDTQIGYKWAKIPGNWMGLWRTLDGDNWDGGYDGDGGFVVFKTGEKLRKIGDVKLDVWLSPNRSANRSGQQYGFFGLAKAEYQEHKIGFQFNSAWGNTWDTILDDVLENDFIAGYSTKVMGVKIDANALVNIYGAYEEPLPQDSTVNIRSFYTPASSDVSQTDPDAALYNNMAAALRLGYTVGIVDLGFGYALRGPQAGMMYVKQWDDEYHLTDSLGILNNQQIYVSASVSPVRNLKVWGKTGASFVFSRDFPYYSNAFTNKDTPTPYSDINNVQLFLDPEAEYNLSPLLGFDSKFHIYTKLKFNTAGDDKFIRGAGTDAVESPVIVNDVAFRFSTGRLNPVFQGLEFTVGFDNEDTEYFFNSYSVSVKLPRQFGVSTGALIRISNPGVAKHDDPFGFFLGMTKELRGFGNPRFWGQFFWNAKPYKDYNDRAELDFGDYMIGSPKDMAGLACFRIGLSWDF